jgi:phosphomannomutase
MLQELFAQRDEQVENAREGLILRKSGGRLLITPGKTGKAVRILAEAANEETAAELAADIERLLAESANR